MEFKKEIKSGEHGNQTQGDDPWHLGPTLLLSSRECQGAGPVMGGVGSRDGSACRCLWKEAEQHGYPTPPGRHRHDGNTLKPTDRLFDKMVREKCTGSGAVADVNCEGNNSEVLDTSPSSLRT